MKTPDALRIFFPECFGGKYKPLKKHNSRRINENGVAYLLSYTVSVEKLWTQNTRIVHDV
jgi:hypothetical protein